MSGWLRNATVLIQPVTTTKECGMSLRLHHWIRDLYLATTDGHGSDLPAALLDRVAVHIPHAVSHWQVVDASGSVLSHCEHHTIRHTALDARGGHKKIPDRAKTPGPRLAAFAVNRHGSQQTHRFTFWRDESAAAFDNEERSTLEQIVEHLAGADMLGRRIASLTVATNGVDGEGVGLAVVNNAGQLTATDAKFTRLLREVVPNWDGRTLPFTLPAEIDPARPGIVFKGLWVGLQRVAAGHELRVRPDRRAVKLSDREIEIAGRVAQGFTFREISKEIGVAPSTVSTHLYNLYAKLGIRRRAELVAWIKQHNGAR